jgi:hypothetical protein
VRQPQRRIFVGLAAALGSTQPRLAAAAPMQDVCCGYDLAGAHLKAELWTFFFYNLF